MFSSLLSRSGTMAAVFAESSGSAAAFAAGGPRFDGLVFVLAVVGGGLLLMRWAGLQRFPGEPTAFGVCWYLNRLWAALWYGVRRQGPCTVPVSGPVILTANHGSTPDPLLLYATCPHRMMSFMIAREYAQLPVFHYFTDIVRCIPVKRDGHDTAAAKAAIRRLREGGVLGIFIEGRIPRPGEVEPPKDGVALLALQSGAVVVPAYISGQVYRDGIAASFFARHRAIVRYGPPLDLQGFDPRDRENLKRATQSIHAAILALKPRQRTSRGGAETT